MSKIIEVDIKDINDVFSMKTISIGNRRPKVAFIKYSSGNY